MFCQSFWILFPLFILIYNKTARSPYSTTILKCIFLEIPYSPFHSNLVFRVPWQLELDGDGRTFSLSSGASSSRISCPRISCSAGWTWSWPFQSWKLSFYVIHVRKKHRFTPSSVSSPSSQSSQTQNLFPEADFHAGQTKHQKHLFQPQTSPSMSILNKKNTYVFVCFIWPSSISS